MAARMLIGLLLAGLCFAGATLWRAQNRETKAERDYPPMGQILTVEGRKVHAVVLGQEAGQSPDLVLIHGASGSTRDMTFRLAAQFTDRYRVIVIDRPGAGYTPAFNPNGESLKEQAELLSKTAAALGAARPIVLGQSYGGAVALAWAVHFPDRLAALVPVAAASNIWPKPLSLLYRVTSHPIGSALVVPLITAWVPSSYVEHSLTGVFAPQEVPAGYSDYFGPHMSLRRASFRANALHRAQILAEITALSQIYDKITVPTEIVHGTDDLTVGYDLHSVQLARQIKGAVLTPLPGLGHMPQHFAVTEIGAAVDRAARRAGLR